MMPRLPQLAMSRELLAWLREDPLWSDLDWRLRSALAWRAFWGSLNARLSRAQDAVGVGTQHPAINPLLVLGPWRSGTTVMHELLTAAIGWPTPLTWQCMDACAFRLTNGQLARRKGVTVARPMDGLALGAASPQEDEFALLTLGAPSAYRAFLMPHRITELLHTLDAEFWLDHPQWLATWEPFLQAVQSDAAPGGGLILKSPNHSFRIKSIAQRFPHAKLVWMLREPLDIFHSNRKMWRTMFNEHGLTPVDPDALDAFLARALCASAEALRWAADHFGPQQFVTCSQEALRREPESCTLRILQTLGLADAVDLQALRNAIEQTRLGKTENYTKPLPAIALDAVQALRDAQDAVSASR